MNNLKTLYPITAALALMPTVSAMAAKKSTTTCDRPNIIFIMTDDQGKGDLGCEGNPYIQTPNIDKFYEDALRLENYHVSTTSAPTRASIMTGRHCNRVNAFHTIMGRSIVFNDEVLLPQVLAQNGYTNAMYGKWHLGDNFPNRPEDRGFHEVVRHGGGGIGQGPDYWMNDYFDDTYYHNGVEEQYEGYCTDVFFSEAMDFITKNKDNPFFCYIATNAPHAPLNVPEEYINKYDSDMEVNGKPIKDNLRRFYGMITNIDDNFKKLEDLLKKLKIADNTILIFTTDNGSAGGSGVYNAGMTGGKGQVTEGGHRVPFFIRWKDGELSGGRDINELVAHYDLLPTFVDLLGLDFNPVKPLDGKSFKTLLVDENPTWENRILYMDTQRQQNLIKYRNFVVMDERWRLINGDKLYDIDVDLAQKKNVIDQYPEVAARLMVGYERWWDSFLAEKVDERHSYIQVGSPKENPVRISAHDMHVGIFRNVWHQMNALSANAASGNWKVQLLETGEYNITICRFPRESGLEINAKVPAVPKSATIDRAMPESTKDDFVTAQMYVAGITNTAKIKEGDKEITFKCKIPEGKFELHAELIDSKELVHPAYYVYIEKLDK